MVQSMRRSKNDTTKFVLRILDKLTAVVMQIQHKLDAWKTPDKCLPPSDKIFGNVRRLKAVSHMGVRGYQILVDIYLYLFIWPIWNTRSTPTHLSHPI